MLVIVFRTGAKNTNHEKERAKYAGGEKGGGACRRKRSLIAMKATPNFVPFVVKCVFLLCLRLGHAGVRRRFVEVIAYYDNETA